jgi:hypothetical protein
MEVGELLPASVLDQGGAGGTNCGFTTFQQCLETVSGIGGFCQRNNLYLDHIRRTGSVALSVPVDRFCAIIRQLRKVNCDPSRLLTAIGTDTILTMSHSEC